VLNGAANVTMKVGAKMSGALVKEVPFSDNLFNFFNAATIIAVRLFAGNVLYYREALDTVNILVACPVMVCGGLILVSLAAVTLLILHEEVSGVQVAGDSGHWHWRLAGHLGTGNDAA